ncbi:hypothetical protein MBM09_15095 [Flaviramulus sp. BrNp1-15]|uniref:hypothetical protein n=1 Tax=Flaviramulus sp. BrNp1-15 TaxID=2916754 RepID=UPI001EE8E7AD|nr:hypothetical protein [Flaviramulus sp. BrNp1-15]ULC59219.1 hypothetical protein MBM09_15095 [Flaviramulus sp. BrNp1-15]
MIHSIKKVLFVIPVVLCFMNMQCEDDIDDSIEICDQTTVISESFYNDMVSANFTIIDADISENCLIIKIGASGCDGNSWEFNLVDSGAIAESSPEQRYLEFQLINEEACLAYFERAISFNISSLQIEGSNEIILHIEGLESSLTYTY